MKLPGITFCLLSIAAAGFYVGLCDDTPCGQSPTPSSVPTEAPSPTLTPFYTEPPVATTCPPCLPNIEPGFSAVDDTVGDCYDADGRMDGGEQIDLTVRFWNMGSCYGDNCYAEVSVDNEHVEIEPDHVELGYINEGDSAYETFRVTVSGEAACEEPVTFTFLTDAYWCEQWWPWSSDLEYSLEMDYEAGEWSCDDTPCGQETALGVRLQMPAQYYAPDDMCWLHAHIGNPGPQTIYDVELFVLLDIGTGEYWFYPSWAHYPPHTDARPLAELPPGTMTENVIDQFDWPQGAGEYSNLTFWGALVDPSTAELLGDFSRWDFSYGME